MVADSGQVPLLSAQCDDRRHFANGCLGSEPAELSQPRDRKLFTNGQEVADSAMPPTAAIETGGAGIKGPWFGDLLGTTPSGEKRRLILFDGMCRLCMGFVGIVVSRDSHGLFRFAPLQSDLGQEVLAWHGLPKDLDSVVLHRDGEVFIRSSAALEILREVDGVLSALYGFIYLPRALRDLGYELVAKSRYSILGHTTISKSGSEAILARLLDTWEPDPNDPMHDCSS
uniref:DUF393 domain-containing protein n=1 Tax=Alexandrium catenella TaxID=2925 RepID=A0A6T9LSG4_ALECA|mmetsp:Transcript_44068/g.118866  ORF Transcript_44068/g.118866 Transcript_44068/m.118866 type:complete len:228 (+) Transcript_44068:50-733(+)